jgi:hypothetical protein
MGLPELNKLSDAEYKQLTPEQLMMYNKEMPKMDYDNQYSHKSYPTAQYQLQNNPDGSKRLVSVVVASPEAKAKLIGDWRDTPKDWGVITHPGVDPEIMDAGYAFNVPLPSIEAEVSEPIGQAAIEVPAPEVQEPAAEPAAEPAPEVPNGLARAKARG